MRSVRRSNFCLRSRAPRRWCGMTLVEVMVAVALTTILLSVVASLTVGLQQWDRRFRTTNVRLDNQARLAEVLRSDIRNADDLSQPEKETFVLTSHNQRQIRYKFRPDGCERVVTAATNATESNEMFTIGVNGS